MASPNIVSVTSIVPHTVSITPADTSRNALVTAPATGATHKINSILMTNIDGSSSYNATVELRLADGSTYRALCYLLTVPAGGTVELMTTGTSLYLLDTSVSGEASTLWATSSTASKITYTCSYTTIS
jgi:hypothetical protein